MARQSSKGNILTSVGFVQALAGMQTKADLANVQRFFRNDVAKGNKFLGIRMGKLFALAKQASPMPLVEIEKLLQSDYYEARMGAVCIMDFQARNKKTDDETRKALFDLYLRKHDRINNWDMVDRGAPFIIGGYLNDKQRAILYKLAKSKNVWERRTAIVSTYYFIRKGDVGDTFRIAAALLKDKHDLIHKAVGSWIRFAGGKDKEQLIEFLDEHAGKMPRVMLRYAIEKLDKRQKKYYMELHT
ncbi:MAG: DNA alkylation repair protein [Cyclobacteriaceae bacterium]|nr:DNA alkylation repair protein [Cyclobacteriaceae bacterium]